ncbi:MAG: carbohydrate ABC transporter permease [Cetobacterium sp.]
MINKLKISYIFILPWIVGLLVFKLYPFAQSIIFSFTDYNFITDSKFVGFNNYKMIFTKDKFFFDSLISTFKFVIISVPLKLIFALFVAMILNKKIKGVNLFRTIFYIPSILAGSVAVAALWKFVFSNEGLVNSFLANIGVQGVSWMGSPNTSIFTLALLPVWQFGSSMIIFLAGLKNIPESLYEAAEIDGAGVIKKFFNITVPMLSPVIFFNLIMQIIVAFQDFTGALLITKGEPMRSTYVYGMYLYEMAFKNFKMGYASALAWILFVIILIFSVLIFGTSKKWVHYNE